jgi:hypothetical protein
MVGQLADVQVGQMVGESSGERRFSSESGNVS